MSKVSDIIGYLTSLACLIFLIFQATKCILKFTHEPKGTDVIIAESAKHPYPAITICPTLGYFANPDYQEVLGKCNLSPAEYFDQAKWIGTGSESYCQTPAQLYEQIIGSFATLIDNIPIMTKNGRVFLNSTEHFKPVDRQDLGKRGSCFTFEIPQNTRIANMLIVGNDHIDIKFSSPGNYYNEDNRYYQIAPESEADIDLNHEVFEVLDYEGEPCINSAEYSRDKCIEDLITKTSMEMVGCTTPYLEDKSSICTDLEKATFANQIYEEGKLRAFLDIVPECPKPCQFLMINFGRTKTNAIEKPKAELFIRFQRYIKVSKVGITYQGLELFAEFGGYLGLLLGVSINQLPEMISGLCSKFIKVKKRSKSPKKQFLF